MITEIRFHNLKTLRDTRLELGRYNMVVGPNGSGKSTLLMGLQLASGQRQFLGSRVRSVGGIEDSEDQSVSVELVWSDPVEGIAFTLAWIASGHAAFGTDRYSPTTTRGRALKKIQSARVYSLNETMIAEPVQLHPDMELRSDGWGLAGVLDRLRDEFPERFEQLNEEVARLLPEFDRILFETPAPGSRGFMLRTREGKAAIRAADLSQGVLLALALLTISYAPDPPSIIGLEEPDRGIHPRLYRDVQDALYRLSYPESFGIDREPVQVIVTTHSPFMLDLHKDHPEEIVIAEKTDHGSVFHRLSDRPDLVEILEDVSLGEAWYSGILGGVPAVR